MVGVPGGVSIVAGVTMVTGGVSMVTGVTMVTGSVLVAGVPGGVSMVAGVTIMVGTSVDGRVRAAVLLPSLVPAGMPPF